MALVPVACTQCGKILRVEKTWKSAKCVYCGTTFSVDKAIKNYNTYVKAAKNSISHTDEMSEKIKKEDMNKTSVKVTKSSMSYADEMRKKAEEIKKQEIAKKEYYDNGIYKEFASRISSLIKEGVSCCMAWRTKFEGIIRFGGCEFPAYQDVTYLYWEYGAEDDFRKDNMGVSINHAANEYFRCYISKEWGSAFYGFCNTEQQINYITEKKGLSHYSPLSVGGKYPIPDNIEFSITKLETALYKELSSLGFKECVVKGIYNDWVIKEPPKNIFGKIKWNATPVEVKREKNELYNLYIKLTW